MVHTLGSLPAIPAALYMLVRHGRILPGSTAGRIYFVCMLIGSISVFLVTRQPVGYGIGIVTLALLLIGYGLGYRTPPLGAARYAQTICLTLTAFLLMVPTVSETLRRVPDGHPLVTDPAAPLLLGAQGVLLLALIAGLTAQVLYLRSHRPSPLGRPAD